MNETKRIRCTNCDKRFTLGAAHQQAYTREDGMDACATCVGCYDVNVEYSYDGTKPAAKTCGKKGCPGL